MSYYILPKINNAIIFSPKIEFKSLEPIVSFSLFNFLKEAKTQLKNVCDENNINVDEVTKFINPYEYIFSKVPNSKYSVSKLKPENNIFYNLLEIINLLNLFDIFENKNILSIHFSNNSLSTIECMNILREDKNDINISFPGYIVDYLLINSSSVLITKNSVDFFIYDLIYDTKNYNNCVIMLLNIVIHILNYQNENGISIIKFSNFFYKPVIDVLYILCNVFEKVYIIKPNTVNILSDEKYIVCKNFIINNSKNQENNVYKEEISKLINFYKGIMKINENVVINMDLRKNEINITSVINNEYQYFFVNKLEEFNITTGQQQIEAHDQLINIFKNKNRDEKLENLKKTNIQKCIQWCEKYKIPYNKFTEMFNSFLTGSSISRFENNTLQEVNLKSENFVDEIKNTETDISFSCEFDSNNLEIDEQDQVIEGQIETEIPIGEKEIGELIEELNEGNLKNKNI